MTLKRLIVPIFVVGILAMGSMAFGQAQDITCGLSTPLGPTPRAASVGHTEPIAAGPGGSSSPVISGDPTAPNPPGQGGIAGDGRLRVTCKNANTSSAVNPGVVVLTIALGVPITNSTSHPSSTTGIRLANITGDLIGAVGLSAVQNSAGNIIVALGNTPVATTGGSNPTIGPAFTVGGGPTNNSTGYGSFEIRGVLVSLAARTGTGAVTASLSSGGGVNIGNVPTTTVTGGSATATATAEVITSVLAPLGDISVPSTNLPSSTVSSFFSNIATGPAVLNSAGGTVKGNFLLRIQEGYADMWRDATQFNGGQLGVFPQAPSSDTLVQIILNNIPSGLDISSCSVTLTNVAGTTATSGTPTINFTNVTATSPILTVNFNAPLSLDDIDVLWLKCNVAVGSAVLPLPSTPVSAQVQMGPTGAALSSGAGNPPLTGLTTGNIPRYNASLVPATPITVVVFPPSQTTLLVPFAFVGSGFNTGLAVSNTTKDPFGTTGGGAAASSGTLTFNFFPAAPSTVTCAPYTTSATTPGGGLGTNGALASGSTFVVNLSELLTAANCGSSFNGYLFITTNFTNAHGSATIYTTSNANAALNSPVLVMQANNTGISSANPRSSPESLGQ